MAQEYFEKAAKLDRLATSSSHEGRTDVIVRWYCQRFTLTLLGYDRHSGDGIKLAARPCSAVHI
jgi:hypothetical protein